MFFLELVREFLKGEVRLGGFCAVAVELFLDSVAVLLLFACYCLESL